MDLGARLQQLRSAFAESQQEMVEARRRLGALTSRAESRDGSIMVIVDSTGQITQLVFRGDSYRDLDSEELSRQILAVVGEAQAQMRRSVMELMPRSPWGGLSAEEMLDPDTDLSAMLPDDLFSPAGSDVTGSQRKAHGRRG
jgi:DNA-binding protein YbaB